MTLRKVFKTWWPLAASWLFMGSELPIVSAVLARMADPKINLAAYGGVVFPLILLIEAPVIMLLSASTALSKDWASYVKIRKYTMWAGGLLTLVHFLLAYTPLYYSVVVRLMGPPEEIIEPAHIGLRIIIPWTWAIAYRRFNQGVLIRFGHSNAVGVGTAIRLLTNVTTLFIGYRIGGLPGIVVGTSGIAVGVMTEAIYAGLRVRPVIKKELKPAPAVGPALSWGMFFNFYIPLAMTSFIMLLVQPLGGAALSRMPLALDSLAVWPVLGGFIFMFRSMGFAYNEVVVALMDEPGSVKNLRRFMVLLVGVTTGTLFLIRMLGGSRFWFVQVSKLDPDLAVLAQNGLWFAMLWPGLAVLRNWYQGVIVNGRRTKGITEAVVVFMLVSSIILFAGVASSKHIGLYVGFAAFLIATVFQVIWLWYRSRPILRRAESRDAKYWSNLAVSQEVTLGG